MNTEAHPEEVKKRRARRRLQSNGIIQRLEQKIDSLEERLKAAERYNDQTYVRKMEVGKDVPITNFVAANVGVVGLKEALTLNHTPLKIIWIILLLGGAAATAYYICNNTIEFLNKEPATKISLQRSRAYDLPPLILCPPWFFGSNNKFADLSNDAIKYSLGYANLHYTYFSMDDNARVAFTDLSLMNVSSFLEAAAKIKKSRPDFQRHNFSSLENYYIDLASDILFDSYEDNSTFKLHFCTGCNASHPPEKIVFSNAICYQFHLNKTTLRSSDEPVNIKMTNTENTGGVLSQSKNSWLMGFMPTVGPRGPALSLIPYSTYNIKLTAQRMISLVNASNCVDTSLNRTCDQRLCTEICLAQQTCQQAGNFKRYNSFAVSKNLSEIKNIADNENLFIDNTLPFYGIWVSTFKRTAHNLTVAYNNRFLNREVDANMTWRYMIDKIGELMFQPGNPLNATPLFEQVRKTFLTWKSSYILFDDYVLHEATILNEHYEAVADCYQSCLPPCDHMIYDITIDHDKLEDETQQSINQSIINLFIRHSGVFQGGIVVWKEVTMMTFSEFVATVGGTLGLFLGCTVMTIAQLLLSFVSYCLDQRAAKVQRDRVMMMSLKE